VLFEQGTLSKQRKPLKSHKKKTKTTFEKMITITADSEVAAGFSRAASFVGTSQGWDIFDPSTPKNGAVKKDYHWALVLPSPRDHDHEKYSFSSAQESRYTQGPLNLDQVTPGFSSHNLAAIPEQSITTEINELPTPQMAEPSSSSSSSDEEEVDSGTSYTKKRRKAIIARYRKKRPLRSFNKKVMYDCRQQFAKARPRVQGRFVKLGTVIPEPEPPALKPKPEPPALKSNKDAAGQSKSSSSLTVELPKDEADIVMGASDTHTLTGRRRRLVDPDFEHGEDEENLYVEPTVKWAQDSPANQRTPANQRIFRKSSLSHFFSH
jgi:hypothetical protein